LPMANRQLEMLEEPPSDKRANHCPKGWNPAAALQRILASDFVHPVITGDFLTKAQHIYYSTRRRQPRISNSASIN
jgi:hypothetical protein